MFSTKPKIYAICDTLPLKKSWCLHPMHGCGPLSSWVGGLRPQPLIVGVR